MSKKVKVHCSWCGKPLERYLSALCKNSFCSTECKGKFSSKKHNPDGYYRHPHLSELNRELNPTRMKYETRVKLRKARLGTGEGKSYPKLFGKHLHRVVAEVKLGRSLRPGEVVHHEDGNKRNACPANLRVFTSQSEHAAEHMQKRGDA